MLPIGDRGLADRQKRGSGEVVGDLVVAHRIEHPRVGVADIA